MGVKADFLKKVTDGFGDPIDIQYRTIAHGTKGLRKIGKYHQHSQPGYPQYYDRTSTAPIVLNTTVRNSNPNAPNVVTDYSYRNFSINKNGLGAEGFQAVQAINRESGSKLHKEYYLKHPLTNYQKNRRLYDGNNRLLSREHFTYNQPPGGSFEPVSYTHLTLPTKRIV